MPKISTYALSSPAELTDELIGSDISKNTKNFTVGSIVDITGIPAGTQNTISMFSSTGLVDSISTQLGPNVEGLYQIKNTNVDRFIIDKPSSVTSGDPEYLITQDGNYKVSMGWDDDGEGFGFLYNWSGNGWRFGAAGNNPELTIVTTAGSEGVVVENKLTVNKAIVSTVVNGLPPFVVTSNATVDNLNAEFFNGFGSLDFINATSNINQDVNGEKAFTDITTFRNFVSQTNLGGSTYFGNGTGYNDDLTTNNNAGFGFQALRDNTSGNCNVAIGYRSLANNTIGADNSSIGERALFNLSGASDNNVAFGNKAGQNIVFNNNALTVSNKSIDRKSVV